MSETSDLSAIAQDLADFDAGAAVLLVRVALVSSLIGRILLVVQEAETEVPERLAIIARSWPSAGIEIGLNAVEFFQGSIRIIPLAEVVIAAEDLLGSLTVTMRVQWEADVGFVGLLARLRGLHLGNPRRW